jgi:enoyl-CoA hydratase/3-hydroxyacyl-CoA dehydrogenase
MFVFKAAVVGAGTMGGEIAWTIANVDIPVVLKDVKPEFVETGLEKARSLWQARVDREKMTPEELERKMALITGTTEYDDFADVDFVIEAVPERMEIKQAVFAELDSVTPGHAILASNTSALSISEIGASTLRPDKVVGFHYFYPASVLPLVEIVEGDETSSQTVTAALNFAQTIRKQPIVCREIPGFVVNRILNAGMSEIWRAQEEQSLSIKKIDEAIGAANIMPMPPFFLIDLLGLDTVYHVAEHLHDAYGDRFYAPQTMRALVEAGKLGAKTGGEGFYKDGEPQVEGDNDPDGEELANLVALRTFAEACLILQDRDCTVREIDLGLMAGAGLDPRRGLLPPFMKADAEGLDVILERLEQAEERHGERFAPPAILRRLVAQGRLGAKAGHGFYAYPRPDDGEQPETVKLETRGSVGIAWLTNGMMNPIAPQVIRDLETVWGRVKDGGEVRALVIASASAVVFSAGADIKSFTQMDEPQGRELMESAHDLFLDIGRAGIATIAAVNSLAFGGGCELAQACDVRIAAESAVFGQPEIKLGIIPGFGGTQRLPRLVGHGKALELNLVGDAIRAEEAYEFGLVNDLVPDEELLDTALNWARKLASQAPVAVGRIKTVSGNGDLEAGIEAEKQAFADAFASEDAKEGIGAFLGKRQPSFKGR